MTTPPYLTGSRAYALTLLLALLAATLSAPAHAQVEVDREFVGPMPTWVDVRETFGAVGDGVADDTAALEAALDATGANLTDLPRVLYLAAGTYRITEQLTWIGRRGVALIGEHPERTRLVWDGPEGGTMFWFNGRDSRFTRLTFDGAGKAHTAFAYQWHSRDPADGQTASTQVEHIDNIYMDVARGIVGGGELGWLDSENFVSRCRFIRCSEFGIGLRHFNAVNWWIWDSRFIDCGVGVTNEPGRYGGIFNVHRCLFRNSRRADMTIYHAGFFGVRDNVSVGSHRFFHALNHGANGASITLQGNTILDHRAPDAIRLETIGCNSLIDNTIVSPTGSASADGGKAGPVVFIGIDAGAAPPQTVPEGVVVDGHVPANALIVGNTFTRPDPVRVIGSSHAQDNRVVDAASLQVEWTEPPGFLPNEDRRIFSVEPGADGETIQRVIDEAAAYALAAPGRRPVVHLPMATYPIERTLVVPAEAPIQIVGDLYYPDHQGTMLRWAGEPGGGPVLRLLGPSKARLAYLGVFGPKLTGRAQAPQRPEAASAAIVVEGCDQPGARVYLQQCITNGVGGVGLLVDGLDETWVEARGHQGEGLRRWGKDWPAEGDTQVPYPSVRVIGGPRTAAGEPTPGRTCLFGANTGRFDVRRGGRLLVRDYWYESNWAPFYMHLSGDGQFTAQCGLDATYTHPKLREAGHASYVFDNFTGRFSLIGVGGHYDAQNPLTRFSGDCTGAKVAIIGITARDGAAFPEPTDTAGTDLLLLANLDNQTVMPPAGNVTAQAVTDALELTRTSRPRHLTALPAGVTDLRLQRVVTGDAQIGLHLKR